MADPADKFYLGAHPFYDADTGAPVDVVNSLECYEVTNDQEWRQANLAGTRASLTSGDVTNQVVVLLMNDFVDNPGVLAPWWAGKGEYLIIGIPDANGKPPSIAHPSFNWQASSGNLALFNVERARVDAGTSYFHGTKQTVTLGGLTWASNRLLFTAYEQGGNNAANPNRPDMPINDEFYLRGILVYGGPDGGRNSHNTYLDRQWKQYLTNFISYGNEAGGNHALKQDGRFIYLGDSVLSNVGVHGALVAEGDYGGQAPGSFVACQEGIIERTVFVNMYGASPFGGSVSRGVGAAQHQVRVAIHGCDDPQGFRSNTYATPAYLGEVQTPYGAYTSAPTAFWTGDWATFPDLAVYYMGNTFVGGNPENRNVPDATWRGPAIVAQPSFPTDYAHGVTSTPFFTLDAPPSSWRERSRIHVLNSCLVDADPAENHVPGRMNCDDPLAPAWVASLASCVADPGGPAENSNKIVFHGSNQCGIEDAVPAAVQSGADALRAIFDPPWTHW